MSEGAALQAQRFNHAGFQHYLSERRLMGSRCAACGEVFLPPRSMCSRCYSTDMEWVQLSGEGRLAGFTLIYVGLPAMAAEGYHRKNPYCSGVVRLAEGPAITAQILGADGALPEGIQVGMLLRALFLERGSGETRRVALAFGPSKPG